MILSLGEITKAQKTSKNQNVYFLKNNGKEVSVKDSADYVRVIQEPDSGEVNFNLLSSPKWIPGTMRGVPVRIKYSIPLKFSLPR